MIFKEQEAVLDYRELLISEQTRWKRVAANLLEFSVSPVEPDGIACKSKWCQFVANF